jgi:exosortase A
MMRQLLGRLFVFSPAGSRRARVADARAGETPGTPGIGQPQARQERPVAQDAGVDSVVKPGIQAAADRISMGVVRRYAPVLAAALAALGILAVYWQTAASIVAIWWRSETFAHGFVVVPICIWLVWRQREELERIAASPWWPGLLGIFGAGVLWLVSSAADALGVKQFALAFMIQAAIVAVVGKSVARALVFPLAFLLFAVPAGEIFVPTLIDWTADFTVSALRWSGVPVYREANHFIIPSGFWSVVEACSGIRYVIASVMVGTIYAAVAYRSAGRRAAFLAASVLVPVIANWLRAYMIVMLAHLTNNKLAVGVDHIIYGWAFFGVVMLLLFWVGSYWQESPLPSDAPAAPSAGPTARVASDPRHGMLFLAAIAAFAVAAIWRPIEAAIERPVNEGVPILASFAGANGWAPSEAPIADWTPHYLGYAADLKQTFRKEGRDVGIYVAYFRNQTKGRELVTSGNVLVTKESWDWRLVAQGSDSIDWAGRQVPVYQAEISGPRVRLDVFRLYWVGGQLTSSPYVAKALTAWSVLSGRGDDSALIVIYAPKSEPEGQARDTLRDFASAMSPAIQRALAAARVGSQ